VIVILDSGVYVSALEFGGPPKEAVAFAVAADQLLICDEIENEVVRVMRDKFGHHPDEILRRLSDYVRGATRIAVIGTLSGICRDPNDDFILECATLGHADIIVTGDKDLLSLKSYGATRILTPSNTWVSLTSTNPARTDPIPVLN
jgi:putative PIN family toxin of toxin-antitoxin system